MKRPEPLIAPSILAADFTRLGEQIDEAEQAGADWLHCDIMDGRFVPNISFGPMVVEAARSRSSELFLDVHLMISEPERYIRDFVEAGADQITVHTEATQHIHRSLEMIIDSGCRAGVAINPGTQVLELEPVLSMVDLVLLMSVNPGFGGQTFIKDSLRRAEQLARMRNSSGFPYLIEIDGGVTMENVGKIVSAGADVLVAGSTIFKSGSIEATIQQMRQKANETIRPVV